MVNQQVQRVRLGYLMRRLLFAPLIFTLLSPVQAGIDPEVHELCLRATDYRGCVAAQSGETPELRVIEGKTEITGNRCPFKYVYVGGGQCQNLTCNMKAWNKNLAHLYGRGVCIKTLFGEQSIQLGDVTAKATFDPKCPDKEPYMLENSSCDNNYYTKEQFN